jgi:hypothetical protein
VPSRAELEQQAALQAALTEMAWQQFQAAWAALGLTSSTVTTAAVIDAVTDMFADLVDAWGDVAATAAADFYDEMRGRAGAAGGFAAILAAAASRNQVAGTVTWAMNTVSPAGEDFDPAAALGKLQGPLQRLIRQTGRATIDESARRDPSRPRVARVPMGDDTCAFCLVLASRGPVYRSTTSAGHDTKYHDFDDCEQVLVWTPDDELPEGYDPGVLYGKYEDARRAAGSSDLRKILRQLRLQEGIR